MIRTSGGCKTCIDVKILAIAPRASKKQVIADSWGEGGRSALGSSGQHCDHQISIEIIALHSIIRSALGLTDQHWDSKFEIVRSSLGSSEQRCDQQVSIEIVRSALGSSDKRWDYQVSIGIIRSALISSSYQHRSELLGKRFMMANLAGMPVLEVCNNLDEFS